MLTLLLKTIHVLGAAVFLGTGLGSAYFKWRGSRSGSPHVVAWTDTEIVRADWVFTVPAGVLMPVTGAALVELYGLSWSTPWVLWGVAGYAVSGSTWIAAAWLQLRMRQLSRHALEQSAPLPARYEQLERAWVALGIPAFTAAVLTVWVMVAKSGP